MEKAISTSRAQARKAITLTLEFMARKLEAIQQDLDRKVGQIDPLAVPQQHLTDR